MMYYLYVMALMNSAFGRLELLPLTKSLATRMDLVRNFNAKKVMNFWMEEASERGILSLC